MNARPTAKASAGPPTARTPRANHTNLADLAYDRLEEMIVSCRLQPGLYLSIQDLQQATGLGRTPTHQAVSRLAADTLIVIRPRHGLQISPIDLARDRTLLLLRRDLERFVVRMATSHAGATHRNQCLHLAQLLRDGGPGMTVERFNQLDRRIDQLLLDAAGEPFLANTLRPLRTISRRVGFVYHSWVQPALGIGGSLPCHLDILDAVAAGRAREATAASDRLMAFCDAMFEELGAGVDPALFDCNKQVAPAVMAGAELVSGS